MSKWLEIDSAPKDGTRVRLKNETNGKHDVGHYEDWTDMPEWQRQMIPEFAKHWHGEWCTDFGEGEMTHWKPI